MKWFTNYCLLIFIGLNLPFLIFQQEYIYLFIVIPNVVMSLIFLGFSYFFLIKRNNLSRFQKLLFFLLFTSYLIWSILYTIYLHHHLIGIEQYFYLVLLYLNFLFIIKFTQDLYNYDNTLHHILPIYLMGNEGSNREPEISFSTL